MTEPRKRLLQAVMNCVSRAFGVYVIWTHDVEVHKKNCLAIQNAGPPQHVYPWNE